MSLSSFGLQAEFVRALKDLGFNQPTPIQKAALPVLVTGRDAILWTAQQRGKTAAYLLPLLERLSTAERGGKRGLVLAADAAEAHRVFDQAASLTRYGELTAALAVGADAAAALAADSSSNLLILAPASLASLLESKPEELAKIGALVVDGLEPWAADGAVELLRRLASLLPEGRQVILLAAEPSLKVASLAHELLRDPAEIKAEAVPAAAAPAAAASAVVAPSGNRQAIYPVHEELKRALLCRFLERPEIRNALVFTRTKHRANRLAEWLKGQGVPSERVHGNRSQRQRADAVEGFRSGAYRVLVATDLAARGIDLDLLCAVVNFDVPSVPDDYVQRAAVVAGEGREGQAITLVSEQEEGALRSIEKAIGAKLERRTVDGFDYETLPDEPFDAPPSERSAESKPRRPEGERPQNGGRPHKNEARRDRPAPVNGSPREPAEWNEDEEEARIRAKAEQMQAAAVAARMQPSRMGIMEYRAPRPQSQSPAKREPRRRSRKRGR